MYPPPYPPLLLLCCLRLLLVRSILQRDYTALNFHERVQIILEAVEIFSTKDPYRSPHRALDSWDAKQISKEIDCTERQDRPETAPKHSNKVGGNDTGARESTTVSGHS